MFWRRGSPPLLAYEMFGGIINTGGSSDVLHFQTRTQKVIYTGTVFLPVSSALNPLILYHLNPISIGIQNKCDVVHPSISQTLLKVHLQRLEAVARSREVVNRDT